MNKRALKIGSKKPLSITINCLSDKHKGNSKSIKLFQKSTEFYLEKKMNVLPASATEEQKNKWLKQNVVAFIPKFRGFWMMKLWYALH